MNLEATYMGLKLRSQIVVSSCTLSEDIGNILQMEDFGAGAVVLFSLFEEQIQAEQDCFNGIIRPNRNTFGELGNLPEMEDYRLSTEEYLENLRRIKERVQIPIIGSLNGVTPEGWIDYARQMEQAGADALEINIYYIPTDLHLTGGPVEKRYLEIVSTVKKNISIPLAVKLSPYFTAIGNTALKMQNSGADALVLFNRFYQPDFDINSLEVLQNLQYSSAAEIRLPLMWISLLSGKLDLSLAGSTGVQSANEAIKYLLAGADVAMVASALYKNGIGYLETIHQELRDWMSSKDFKSLSDFKGLMNQTQVSDPEVYGRANYIRILKKG
jgi:dihydroorotate dehydrogenase (fumarate)